jgi:hypothetical protein
MKIRIQAHSTYGYTLLAFTCVSLVTSPLWAADRAPLPALQSLPPVKVFARCYMQMTRRYPAANNPWLLQVKAGQMKPSDACMGVLTAALLDPATGKLAQDTAETRAVIQTLNDFHRTWFSGDYLVSAIPNNMDIPDMTINIVDGSEPALHITRALLKPQTPYHDVFTGSIALEAQRANGYPMTGIWGHTPADRYVQYWDNQPTPAPGATPAPAEIPFFPDAIGATSPRPIFLQKGPLIGVAPMHPSKISRTVSLYKWDNSVPVFPFRSYGGGILGTQSYLMLNFGRLMDETADGGLLLPRRWSKAVMKDLLCRELPVLRTSDVSAYADQYSQLPFRKAASCLACHATTDPMASGVRNMAYKITTNIQSEQHTVTTFMASYLATMGNDRSDIIPGIAGGVDANFNKRIPSGTLFYRGYDGHLIRKNFVGVGDLGSQISAEEDPYVCAASRYFQFFTGIKVDLSDLGAPGARELTSDELIYRDIVINLGKNLKQDPDQNLRHLVREILELPFYSNASIREGR